MLAVAQNKHGVVDAHNEEDDDKKADQEKTFFQKNVLDYK
jgi:hypothetical protein